jgi:uncharacterized protein (DUF2267 family)
MRYDEFVGRVQHRARLSSLDEAVGAVRATLAVLGQRLSGGEAGDLAAQLPPEIGRYLREAGMSGERFGLETFFERVSEQEGMNRPDAVHHARAVIAVLGEAVSPGEIKDVRAQLPAEYDPLFESGSEGALA